MSGERAGGAGPPGPGRSCRFGQRAVGLGEGVSEVEGGAGGVGELLIELVGEGAGVGELGGEVLAPGGGGGRVHGRSSPRRPGPVGPGRRRWSVWGFVVFDLVAAVR